MIEQKSPTILVNACETQAQNLVMRCMYYNTKNEFFQHQIIKEPVGLFYY